MKKILLFMLGAIMVIGCIGLTACGGSSDEETTTEATSEDINEETAARTMFYGGFGYMGEDPVVGAVYEYMATVVAQEYEPGEDLVSIPVVCIVDQVENEDGTVDVLGNFQIYNYKVKGDTLETESGGTHPGKMHLVPDGDYYKADSFEQVADGSDFDSSAKEIFGDKYDDFMKVYSDDKTMNDLRTQAIRDYVQATGLEVTQYQDYGWDPVQL